MAQYIAFLRGINVGGHRIKMDQLRVHFEEMGLTDVSTFIASGNVIFSADSEDVGDLSARIEQHLAQKLGYEVATFLRTPAQLDAIATLELPEGEDGAESFSSIYVSLLRGPAPDDMRARFADLATESDRFWFSGSEMYWGLQGKISESPLFGKGLELAFAGAPTTSRNMNTLRRLAAKLAP